MLLHLASFDHWADFVSALKRIPCHFDLVINIVEGLNTEQQLGYQRDLVKHSYPQATVIQSANRGMDIGGMLRLFQQIKDADYQLVLYAHSKSDTRWRQTLLDILTKVDERLLEALRSPSTKLGMLGAYAYPFDYFNIKPYMSLAQQLGITISTTWQQVYQQHPSAEQLAIKQRVEWAKQQQVADLRPEVDLEYAEWIMRGRSQDCEQQLMRQDLLKHFIADRVMRSLSYFPGNFFWLKHSLIKLLAAKINLADEFQQLPLGLASDLEQQSRAHAWERILPVFVEKNGYFARPLAQLKT